MNMNSEFVHRPVTPPDDSQRKKSAVLADMKDQSTKATAADPVASTRSAKPFAHNTASHHDVSGNAVSLDQSPSDKTHPMMDQTHLDQSRTMGHTGASSMGTTHTRHQDDLDMQRNSVTRRIERECYDLLQWRNPMRSGATLATIVGSILLTRSYSLLQIGSALLTVAIGLNLVYVTFVVQTQKVFAETSEAVHPYRGMIGRKDQMAPVDKRLVQHYSSLFVDISETVIRALARIVFIEDTMTSVKWFAIFYLTWAISAHVSSRIIILFFVTSAFIFPRLYLSNKGIVDSHLMHGEALLKEHMNSAQEMAKENMGSAMAKTKAYFAKSGTTSSDAKNSINNTSASIKTD